MSTAYEDLEELLHNLEQLIRDMQEMMNSVKEMVDLIDTIQWKLGMKDDDS